ncbi:DUF7619 domain-containing protein [Spirosoma flavus]
MAYSDRYGLFVVGEFGQWGINAGAAALLTQTNDTPDKDFPRIYENVVDAVEDGANGWYIAGSTFTSINEYDSVTYSYTGLIHIRADKRIDPNFRIRSTSVDWQRSSIRKIARWRNTIFVTGYLSFFSGPATALLAFNATTGEQIPIPIVKTSLSDNYLTNCLVYGNSLYLAGTITGFNGTAIERSVLAIDLTTNTLKNWGSFQNNSTQSWGGSQNMVASNGKMLIGTTLNGYRGIAAFDTLTATAPIWQAFVNASIFCANAQYIFFPTSNPPYDGSFIIRSLDINTGQDNPNWSSSAYSFRRTTCTQCATNAFNIACTANTVYVQGNFDKINNTISQKLVAAITISTNTLSTWHPKPSEGLPGFYRISENSILSLGTNGVYYKTQSRNKAALLNPVSGELVHRTFDYLPVDSDLTTENRAIIRAAAFQGDTVWIGGQLANLWGLSAHSIQRGDTLLKKPMQFYSFNYVGSVRQELLTNLVNKLIPIDSVVYVAGQFDKINTTYRQALAAISLKGNVQSFSLTVNSNQINDFKIVGDLIYLCGGFTTVNGVARKYLACVNRFTGQLTNWNPDPDQPITNIEVSDRHIIFSAAVSRVGSFTNTQGGRLRNFAIDMVTGQVVRAWGNQESIFTSVVNAQYLFTSFNANAPCGTGTIGLSYYDLQYDKYARNCIIRDRFTASKMIFAGQRLFFLPKKIYYNAAIDSDQKLMQVRFPAGFFNDELSYFPKQGSNGGATTTNFYGYKLGYGTKVRLTRVGEVPISVPDSAVKYPESFQVEARINLRGKAVGDWNIEITTPSGERTIVANGFRINQATPPKIRVRIISPRAIRRGAPTALPIAITNEGEEDAELVPVYLVFQNDVSVKLPIDVHIDSSFVRTDTLNRIPISMLGGKPFNGWASWIGIPRLGGGETAELPVVIRTATDNPVIVQAYSSQPLMGYDPNDPCRPKSRTEQCQEGLIGGAFDLLGLIPVVGEITGCAQGVYDIFKKKCGDKDAFDIYGSTAGAIWSCSGKLLTRKAETYGKVAEIISDFLGWGSGLSNAGKIYDNCFEPDEKHPAEARIPGVSSQDPNDKLGPAGAGKARYVAAENTLNYTIRFENYASASAAAQYVEVLDTLDQTKFDLSTFQFGHFNVADTNFYAPPGRKYYLRDWDLRPTKNLILRMEAKFNSITGILKATYTALDPQTMEWTTDPILGFLPPNRQAPEGEGSVFFSILTKSSLPHNTTITNRAAIIFDYNAAIKTPSWNNVVDKITPVSQVATLPTSIQSSTFTVQWSGHDEGAGVRLYNLYVATNNGAYKLAAQNTMLSSITFTGQPDSTYRFYTIAVDSVGNEEATPVVFDTQTTVRLPGLIESIQNGDWDSTTTWSCGCIPESMSTVTIGHLVTIPSNKQVRIGKVKYKANGRVKFSGGASLRFSSN